MLESTLSASAELSGELGTLEFAPQSQEVYVELVAFMAGQLTSISTDPGNQLQAGQDGGLFVQTLWADVPDW